jgi:tRNA threonylcarbamoyl adenosine modification protein YeaZ
MSTSLVIDTSTNRTVVGVVTGGKLIWSGYRDGATAHGPSLPLLVTEAIAQHRIDQVIVGMGPGPFTGLRVGIAFAHTFARARNIEVIGICSLDAIAAHIDEKDFIVATDARRKEWYWARYTKGIRIGEPAVSFPTDVEKLGTTVHFGLFPDLIAMTKLATQNTIAEPMYLRRPDAVATVDRT